MVDVTLDPFISCGQTRWGVKNWQNQSGVNAVFGRNNSCGPSGAGIIVDRTNYIKVTTKNSTSLQGAWQAGIQGTDPWGTKDTDGTQPAVNHNTVMPLSSGLFYQLEVQYLWYRSATSKPASSTANVMANMLVNFWFGDKTKKVIVGGKPSTKTRL